MCEFAPYRQFLWGSSLMISPVVEKVIFHRTKRQEQFPPNFFNILCLKSGLRERGRLFPGLPLVRPFLLGDGGPNRGGDLETIVYVAV